MWEPGQALVSFHCPSDRLPCWLLGSVPISEHSETQPGWPRATCLRPSLWSEPQGFPAAAHGAVEQGP